MSHQARFEEVRDRYKSLVDAGGDPRLFACTIGEAVGYCDHRGRQYQDAHGRGVLAPPDKRKAAPGDFKFDLLAEAMIGRDWKELLFGRSGDAFNFLPHIREAARAGAISETRRPVREEMAAPIGPSVWANVAAWSATVGGLLGAQFNLGYETAEFEFAELFPIRPAVFWQGGERYIDIIGPFQPAQAVGPGEEYPDHAMSAMWVEPGAMIKYAGKISLTREMVEIDMSGGQMLSRANDGGFTLKFRENELSLDAITGTGDAGNNFKLGMLQDTSATAYNTYGPTITNPAGTARTIPNDILNPLNDTGALQVSDEQLANLYHPVTDNPLMVKLGTALFPTPMAAFASRFVDAAEWDMWTQNIAGPAQAAPGTFPSAQSRGRNPWQGLVKPIVSRWLHDRHVKSTTKTDPNRSAGNGLSGSAVYRWYRLDPAKFACRRQKWAAQSQAINAADYVMATQGIAAAFVWNMAVMVQILSPYHIQRNKAA